MFEVALTLVVLLFVSGAGVVMVRLRGAGAVENESAAPLTPETH
ncbi:hypothetical protein [Microbacterium sp. 179-I 3D4 NHS]